MKKPHFFQKKEPADVNYETPDWLFNLLDEEFDFKFDLAAVKENAKAKFFKNSLPVDWHKLNGWLWLNPPFAGIRSWIEKAQYESKKGAKIVVLTPSTVLGSPYLKDCHPKELRFVSGIPVFKNTFSGKKIRFAPVLMVFDNERARRKFSFIAKPPNHSTWCQKAST